jgi:outer membrane protein TolC
MADGIKMEIHSAYQNYLESLKKIEVYQKAVIQSNENYRITKNKYDNALATTTDLLDADVAQLQAGINFEYAKADAVVAYNKLYEAAGLINGISPANK